MDDAVAERFLEEEEAVSVAGLDPLDRARFARLVRQCAANWLQHSRVGLRVTRGKYGMALHFEGPLGDKVASIFSLRAHHNTAEYRFVGPNPDRRRLGLSKETQDALDRLRDLYEALLAGKDGAGDTVTCVLNGARTPDLVPLVEETRRTLGGGMEAAASTAKKPRAAPAKVAAPAPISAAAAPLGAGAEGDGGKPINVTTLRLACPEPGAIVDFWARVLKRRPAERDSENGGAICLGGLVLRVTGPVDSRTEEAWGYGSSETPGPGLLPTLLVPDFDLCLRRARRIGDAIVEEDKKAGRFVVKDPAGFAMEITRD